MRIIKNILSQLHVYVVWLILSVVLWGFVFNFLTDAPAEKKLVLFAEVSGVQDRGFCAELEKNKPAGIRMIQAHSFDYVMFDEQSLINADVYIVPRESVEAYRDSFRALDLSKLKAEKLSFYEIDGKPCGIRVWDGKAGSASAYFAYGEGEYYLFLGANSLHAGDVDDAAYWMIGEILQMKNETDH